MTPVKSVESGAHQMLNGAEAVGQPGQEVGYKPASGRSGNKLSIQPLAHLRNQTVGSELLLIL